MQAKILENKISTLLCGFINKFLIVPLFLSSIIIFEEI